MVRRDLNLEFLKILRILVALKKFKYLLQNLGHGHRAAGHLNVHRPFKVGDDN